MTPSPLVSLRLQFRFLSDKYSTLVEEKQMGQKECEVGPTIGEKPQLHNYWSDQNFENIRF